MEREFKNKKIVVRLSESQLIKLTNTLVGEEKTKSQFIREAIKEKLKSKK